MSTHELLSNLKSIRSKQPWMVLSAAQKFSLSNARNASISHFYSFEVKDDDEAIFAIPDGCVDILFDCDSSRPSAKVYGTPLEATSIPFNRGHRYFGVRFSAGIMPDFLATSAQELVCNEHTLNEINPNINQLFEQVINTECFTEQVAYFEQFYGHQEARKCSATTYQVMKSIYQHNGNIKIQDMETLTGYTRRTIQRLFIDDIGVSPKLFSRIVRCQSAVYNINHSDHLELSNLAFDLGFSDQSHFQKEFKKLVSTTPLLYKNSVKHDDYINKLHYL
ncbi:helix-turn-helix domain-containing protein [Marinomonas sp. TI.3.20]|uniref:helix-turn-helix domain-containing protein n=1 Tax=Marinomonas sp. TI.3.20 TaxID=3121296 RepID=UPI00311F42F8